MGAAHVGKPARRHCPLSMQEVQEIMSAKKRRAGETVLAGEISVTERARRKEQSILLLMQQTIAALGAARLDTLDTEQARALLPTSRLLLVALNNILLADRDEAARGEAGTETGEENFSTVVWAAALKKALALLQRQEAEAQVAALAAASSRERSDLDTPSSAASEGREQPMAVEAPKSGFLVCIGDDPALKIDLAMFRAVKRETGIHFHRILNATSGAIADHLRRERELGHPVRYVHLACHGGSEGILLADGLVDGDWLSANLQGVEVLLLAACNGEVIADWLVVVPYVLSFSDAIEHGDAAVVTRNFWRAIARGAAVDEAYEAAMAKARPHIAEFVVKHW